MKNVFGQALQSCCMNPITGFYRDGFCRTDEHDQGRHTVCAVMTAEFLSFSKAKGNDLSTPLPQYQFPGLKPGDQWCLCALRWKEAFEAGKAPQVILEATNEKTLDYIALNDLIAHAYRNKI